MQNLINMCISSLAFSIKWGSMSLMVIVGISCVLRLFQYTLVKTRHASYHKLEQLKLITNELDAIKRSMYTVCAAPTTPKHHRIDNLVGDFNVWVNKHAQELSIIFSIKMITALMCSILYVYTTYTGNVHYSLLIFILALECTTFDLMGIYKTGNMMEIRSFSLISMLVTVMFIGIDLIVPSFNDLTINISIFALIFWYVIYELMVLRKISTKYIREATDLFGGEFSPVEAHAYLQKVSSLSATSIFEILDGLSIGASSSEFENAMLKCVQYTDYQLLEAYQSVYKHSTDTFDKMFDDKYFEKLRLQKSFIIQIIDTHTIGKVGDEK